MSKFKVGDRVKVISDTCLHGRRVGEVIEIEGMGYRVAIPSNRPAWGIVGSPCYISERDIEPIENRHEIHITCTDGKTTHAVKKVDGKIVARSRADCCSADEFDFAVGAKLAYDRLMRPETLEKAQPEQPKQEDKPKFKVGDRVIANGVITTKKFSGEVGTIKLAGTRNHFWVAFDEDVGGWGDSGYGIASGHGWTIPAANLEPYTEPESTEPKQEPEKAEPEYLNMKVVCVAGSDGFTVGKTYEFKNGVVVDDDGDVRPSGGDQKITSLSDTYLRDWENKFIEFKGE